MSAAHLYIFGWSQIKFSEVETEELRFGEQCGSDALPIRHQSSYAFPEHSLSFAIKILRMHKFEHKPTFTPVFTAVGAAAGAGVRAAVSISPSSTPPRPVCPAPSVQSPTGPRTTHLWISIGYLFSFCKTCLLADTICKPSVPPAKIGCEMQCDRFSIQ